MAELANYLDVQRALQEQAPAILRQIPVSAVQLSLPLDGKGARIHASVKAGDQGRVPRHVEVVIEGRRIRIPVEAVTDYREYRAY